MALSFHFKQDGGKLTGTFDDPMSKDPVEIANGKIDGEKISFDTTFNGMTIYHEDKIDGDEIKLHVKSDTGRVPSMDITLTLKIKRNGPEMRSVESDQIPEPVSSSASAASASSS